MRISTPELEVVRFAADDVIATSMFIITNPSGMEAGTYIVEGFMEPHDTDTWTVSWRGDFEKLGENDLESINADNGYTWDGKPVYDAYMLPDDLGGYIYTKGASYFELYGGQ